MSREFKPGDVVALWVNDSPATAVRVAAGVLRGGPDGPCWMLLTIDEEAKGDGGFVRDWDGDRPRPLVVLDPENAEDVRRLLAAITVGFPKIVVGLSPDEDREQIDALYLDAMQAALRELANPTPPRIDQPGTWGVVEASCVHSEKPRNWVRHEDGNWRTTGSDQRDGWDDLIDPVLIREGVQA